MAVICDHIDTFRRSFPQAPDRLLGRLTNRGKLNVRKAKESTRACTRACSCASPTPHARSWRAWQACRARRSQGHAIAAPTSSAQTAIAVDPGHGYLFRALVLPLGHISVIEVSRPASGILRALAPSIDRPSRSPGKHGSCKCSGAWRYSRDRNCWFYCGRGFCYRSRGGHRKDGSKAPRPAPTLPSR